ncbi:MAG: quinone-dependent dihydroorotate dehydrogenase [Chitinophagaceae bacterium]|nr:quinone-dependent dihydroorotate dehydrogenase [Chitinophagaceae bacterium]
MYDILRKMLFWFPPEEVHYFSMSGLSLAGKIPGVKKIFRSRLPSDPGLQKELLGLTFTNPVGLAAGFDKNAKYLDELQMLGFGFIEIGTVTPKAQEGNEKPRLFRVPEHQAIINRMGFNNDGVKAVAQRLRQWRNSNKKDGSNKLIIGGNIGKNKITPNEEAWKDYELCFRELFDCVDYFVVNVSSPNTPCLRELQEKESLNKILGHLQTINKQQLSPKPILLKIAPDLTISQIDDVIDLAMEIKLDGLVATNTTISRERLTSVPKEKITAIGAGGLSGKPLKERSTEIVQYIHEKTNGAIPIIASGGIFTVKDAKEKFAAGASLIQVWTGFIYEGPDIVKNICKGLL